VSPNHDPTRGLRRVKPEVVAVPWFGARSSGGAARGDRASCGGFKRNQHLHENSPKVPYPTRLSGSDIFHPHMSRQDRFPLPSGCRNCGANEGKAGQCEAREGNRKTESFRWDKSQVRVPTRVSSLAQVLFKSRPPRQPNIVKFLGNPPSGGKARWAAFAPWQQMGTKFLRIRCYRQQSAAICVATLRNSRIESQPVDLAA